MEKSVSGGYSTGGKCPLISIIIPVYNVAPYIREAVESAVNQTYKNLEIILIDDGSTDGSGQICDEYASRDPRITAIHQKHHGVSDARNVGLNLVTGDYIAFLDPDDAYDPSFIHCMLDTIRQTKCDIVICKYKGYYTENKMDTKKGSICPLSDSGKYNRAKALHELLDCHFRMAVWNKFYKSELWESVRFRTDLIAASDHLVSFQVFDRCNSVYVIDKPLYLYRKHQGSISGNFSVKNIECQILSRSLVEDFLRSHSPSDFSDTQIKKYEKTRLDGMFSYYVRCQDKLFSDYLKKQIIDMAGRVGIENCEYKTRIKFYLMCHSSWLLKYISTVYLPTKLFFRKVLGR